MNEIPIGLCQCGCGFSTNTSNYTSKRFGYVKGQPRRFVAGHNGRRPLVERFWEKVDIRSPVECWLWLAATTEAGYGVIGVGRDTIDYAHRVSYELHIRALEPGEIVLHSCDNAPCVNPNHLAAGTHNDNQQDMIRKGRAKHARGEDHSQALLVEKAVREILQALDDGCDKKTLANKYGVSPWTINNIGRRESWKHVERFLGGRWIG